MKTKILSVLLAALPLGAHAFEAIDTLPWPTTGLFPAYPADPDLPLRVWAQAGYMYDSNVFRQSSAVQSEQIMRFGGGIRNDFRVVGRQTLRLQAEVNAMAYATFGELDHIAYGLLGEWRYELGNDLAGTIGYTRRRFQADLAEVARGVEDLITDNRFYATGVYRLGPTVRLRGGADHSVIERPSRTTAELRSTGVTVGADYVSALGNTIGVEARAAHGDAPVPEIVAGAPGGIANNDYNFREVALVAGYQLGAMLRATGRVGRTNITYTDLPGRDFNGASARGRLEWLPGTKTILSIDVYREPRTIIDVAATHVDVKGATFGASWAPTQKLVFSARFLSENRDFEGDPNVAVGGPVRQDTVRAFRLGAGWEPARHFQVGLALDRGLRDSSALGREYQFTAVMANIRWNY